MAEHQLEASVTGVNEPPDIWFETTDQANYNDSGFGLSDETQIWYFPIDYTGPPATVTQIRVYTRSDYSGFCRLALYSSNGGLPGTLLFGGDIQAFALNGYTVMDVGSISIATGGLYWLAVRASDETSPGGPAVFWIESSQPPGTSEGTGRYNVIAEQTIDSDWPNPSPTIYSWSSYFYAGIFTSYQGANLTVTRGLQAATADGAIVAGTLAIIGLIQATVTGQATVTADLMVARLEASITGVATVTATLGVLTALGASSAGVAVGVGVLSIGELVAIDPFVSAQTGRVIRNGLVVGKPQRPTKVINFRGE